MSYLIKLHPTPALLDSVLNNSKHGGTVYHSLSPNYRPNLVYQNNAQELSTSVSALKILPLKKRVSKKKEYVLYKEQAIDLDKLTKLIKTNNSKAASKKKVILYKKAPSLTKMLDKNFDSTKSYDPNMLHYNVKVEKFFKEHSCSKEIKNINSARALILKEPKEADKLLANTMYSDKTSTLENIAKDQNMLKEQNSEIRRNFSVTKQDLYRFLEVNKVKQQPSARILSQKPKPSTQEEVKERLRETLVPVTHNNMRLKLKEDSSVEENIDFEKYSSSTTTYYNLVKVLHSSIDIHVTNNMVLKGFELLNFHRKKFIWRQVLQEESKSLCEVYNTLLHGLSQNGDWFLMQNVIKWMASDNIKLNSESFAALFYCLAKVKDSKNENLVQEELNKVINQLFVYNVSLNDIFSKTILTKEKTEKILALIQEAVPSFDIEPVTINLNSDCPLTKNLHLAENNLESPLDNLDIESMKNFVEEQILLEKKFFIDVKSVSRGPACNSPEQYKKRLSNLKKDWRKSLIKALENSLYNLDKSQKQTLNLYLNSLPPAKIVDIMMEVAVNLMEFSGGYSPTTSQCSFLISNRMSYCYQIKKKILNGNLERTKILLNDYLLWYQKPCGPARNSRHKWLMLLQDYDRTSQLDSDIIKWPDEIKTMVGKYLLDLVLKTLKFPVEKNGEITLYPVLCTVLRYRDGVYREEIKCHPRISNLFQKTGFEVLSFKADQMPMVCPPKPWKSVNDGGFLCLPTDFIRKSFPSVGKVLRLKDVPPQNMYPTFDALNALQQIPWMINEDVLDVALEIFRNGGSEKLSVPHYPEEKELDNDTNENSTFQDRMNKRLSKMEMRRKMCDEYGLWCEALYRLSLANHFRKRVFWLPQNCDFRGRVYPVPALLNHLGADLYRSLLVFAKGKPLGPKGLDWLKIHLINLTGSHKQRTVAERLAYANEIIPLIVDSAEKPLTGNKWWMESDEPWQTLATCMEIKKALSVPDLENYVSKLPIHQDGSCNGLQHYAGLGKDTIGAESVNLACLEAPQDVYTVVAKLIEEERAKDAERGIEVAQKLNGFIRRKVVKQTIMTTVYGVTPYGARLQISKRLEEIPDFPKDYVNPAAAYLADKTFLSLTKMFTSAKSIQEWFIKCANAISSINDFVQWVSPLGLPVLQPYGRLARQENILLPNKVKQKNAFPPNYIHSLDSTHMMLTALFCEQAGVTFAAVHDCFWTHPCTVDAMNKICREQFISLHSQPLLDNLSQFFMKHYLQNNVSKNEDLAITFEAVPAKGSFDLKEVLNSVYFFS